MKTIELIIKKTAIMMSSGELQNEKSWHQKCIKNPNSYKNSLLLLSEKKAVNVDILTF